MDDAREFLGNKELGQSGVINDIHPHKTKAGISLQAFEARQLESRIVIVVEVVDADDLVAPLKKPLCNMQTDKTSRAGKQDFHGRRPIGKDSNPWARIVAGS